MSNDFIWVEKYRPTILNEIILPEKTHKIIKGYIKQKNIPHLLMSTPKPGSGKTSLAKIIVKELNSDILFINGSLNGSIDTLRNSIEKFAGTGSMFHDKKVVVIDEADHISNKFEDAMRGVLEEFHKNCSFIFTCNRIEKIIEPIISRCQQVYFQYDTVEDRKNAKIKIYKRLEYILQNENISFKPEVIMDIVNKKFPDIRSMINLLQYESTGGEIDHYVLDRLENTDYDNLFDIIKKKNFKDLRKFVANQYINDFNLYRKLFDILDIYLIPNSIPNAISIINEAQFKATFNLDKEIVLLTCLMEIMKDCEVK